MFISYGNGSTFAPTKKVVIKLMMHIKIMKVLGNKQCGLHSVPNNFLNVWDVLLFGSVIKEVQFLTSEKLNE